MPRVCQVKIYTQQEGLVDIHHYVRDDLVKCTQHVLNPNPNYVVELYYSRQHRIRSDTTVIIIG
jgi:hypothetical protein